MTEQESWERTRSGEVEPEAMGPAEIANRFAAARARGEPFWLWPDLEKRAWRMALRELERATATLLAGSAAGLDAALPARALQVAAYTSGLGPWLGWHHECGRLSCDAVHAAVLSGHLEHARRRARVLDAVLCAAVSVLRAAGVGTTVLKGMHTSHSYFAEPALRPMADVDLLVARGDVGRAEAALARSGYTSTPGTGHARPYRSDWRPPGHAGPIRSLALVHAEDPCGIDLHGSADIDFFGVRTVAFDRVLLRSRSPWSIGDVCVLAQPLLAAHLAIHASHGLHSLTLIRVVELVLVLRRDFESNRAWEALRDLLRELRAERFAWPSLLMVERLAPGTVPAPVLADLGRAAPPRLRRVVEPLRPADAQRLESLSVAERFMWSASVAEHFSRAARMLLPTRLGRDFVEVYRRRWYRLLRGRVHWHHADS